MRRNMFEQHKFKSVVILLLMTGFLFACSKQKEEEEEELEDFELDVSYFSHLERNKLYIIRSYEEFVELFGSNVPPEEELEICFHHCKSLLVVRGQSGYLVTGKSFNQIDENKYEFNITLKQISATSEWEVAVVVHKLYEEDEVRLNIVYGK